MAGVGMYSLWRVGLLKFHSWIDLVEQGHYCITVQRLRDQDDRLTREYVVPWSTSNSGPEYTRACRRRSCWHCQYNARRKTRKRVAGWIHGLDRDEYRFVTLTLPGDWYPVRHMALAEQHDQLMKSFRSWRGKRRYRGKPVQGFACVEHTANTGEDGEPGTWHSHVHGVFRWTEHEDLADVRRTWTESVDRDMRKSLDKWTDGSFTNDSRVFDIKRINDDDIGSYLTKVTNYVTKGSAAMADEAAKALYRKRLSGWYGNRN
jgi:hypothetical protein